MADYKLFCLGNPKLEQNEHPVKLEMRKSLALLIYLRFIGHDCSRESLAVLFWPEYDQQHALGNLRRSLSSLNKSLGLDVFNTSREKIGLNDPSQIWLDVEEFREQLAFRNAHEHPQNETCPKCMAALERALELYRGNFLEGFNLANCPEFDEWQFLQRENLSQELSVTLQTIAEAYASHSQWKPAISHARRWVNIDRTNESAWRALMELYARSGQRALALHVFEELTRFLKDELDLQPELETRQLYDKLREHENSTKAVESIQQTSTTPLLKTKLYLPTLPSGCVNRSELTNRLSDIAQKTLTIISAPPGFGKTTLLAEWIAQSSLPVAWLSLDKGDNDFHRFLEYVIAALDNIQENIGREARQIMRSFQTISPHIILASLINDLGKITDPYALILDDYHFITEQTVHDAVGYLLDHLPVNVHIVISTRVDPPLQLGRLRAHSQLLELRSQDLRFNEEEAAHFLNTVMRLSLSKQDVEALQARTEGWVVGLKMAALSMQGRRDASDFILAFSGSHRYVLDYLVEEVLKRQPAYIQTFLLETSILEKLNGALCDALMTEEWKKSGESGQSVLEYLEKSNLFIIPLDENSQWFRYHHLFADLLQSRLDRFSRGKRGSLHWRASQWFGEQGLLLEAIDHAILSKDFQQAADLVDKCAQTNMQVNVFPGRKWIDQIPEEIIFQHPWISVTQAWIWLVRGQLERIPEYIAKAEECICQDEQRWANTAETQDLCGNIAMLRAYIAFFQGSTALAIERATYALQNIRLSNTSLRSRIALQLGEAYSSLGELEEGIRYLNESISLSMIGLDYGVATVAFFRLAPLLKIQGKLVEAEKLYRRSFQVLKEMCEFETPIYGKPEVGLGDLLRERGELDEAARLLELGHKHCKLLEQPYDLIYSYMYVARLLQSQKKYEQGLEMLSEAESLFSGYSIPPVVRIGFDSYQVNLWIKTGNLSQAEDWINSHPIDQKIKGNYQSETGLILKARVLLAQGRLAEAQDLLIQLAASAESCGRYGRLIEILIILALTSQAAGMQGEAQKYITEALLLAEPQGYQRIFLDEDRPMIQLLEGLQKSDLSPRLSNYVKRLLAAQ